MTSDREPTPEMRSLIPDSEARDALFQLSAIYGGHDHIFRIISVAHTEIDEGQEGYVEEIIPGMTDDAPAYILVQVDKTHLHITFDENLHTLPLNVVHGLLGS